MDSEFNNKVLYKTELMYHTKYNVWIIKKNVLTDQGQLPSL